jgi:hypothetical protein
MDQAIVTQTSSRRPTLSHPSDGPSARRVIES